MTRCGHWIVTNASALTCPRCVPQCVGDDTHGWGPISLAPGFLLSSDALKRHVAIKLAEQEIAESYQRSTRLTSSSASEPNRSQPRSSRPSWTSDFSVPCWLRCRLSYLLSSSFTFRKWVDSLSLSDSFPLNKGERHGRNQRAVAKFAILYNLALDLYRDSLDGTYGMTERQQLLKSIAATTADYRVNELGGGRLSI